MAFSEQKIIDKIEVVETGAIQVRQVTRFFSDDELIAQTFHRWSFAPGSDISEMPENVQAVANAIWTDDVVSAYQNRLILMEGN
jgi:hypothetical protein